ncbi:class I SAM-dependent methyltransferase [SAR86 cluster bacterium]|nr:class I SAM-dependent methyltransferase [SAR86 cluster bacterium]
MKVNQCRSCKSDRLKKIIDLGEHPPADTFIPEKFKGIDLPSYPLQLSMCLECNHVFTSFYVSPEERYQRYEYSYDSSNSVVSEGHFKSFSDSVLEYLPFKEDSLIIDIGSNVGTLLSKFFERGFANILGIEPSKNISDIALKKGIKTINKFFNKDLKHHINFQDKADCILSANVFNHTDDIREVLDLVTELLSEDGLLVFEVPYLLDLIKQNAFDTIYHEHVHYFSVKSLKVILNQYGLEIVKLENIDYMCGSLRVYCQKFSKEIKEDSQVNIAIKNENLFGLFDIETYESFMKNIFTMKKELKKDISNILLEGGKIVGVGAATKGNTLLNFCDLNETSISYLVDTSNLKIGKFAPGSMIPIKHDDEIEEEVTHLLILPWNISEYLVKKLSFLEKKFLIPQLKK